MASSHATPKSNAGEEEKATDTSTAIDVPSVAQAQKQQDAKPTPQQAQRIAALEAKIASLQHQIRETESKHNGITAQLKSPKTPEDTVRQHIARLHSYNEIRDVGQGLMGLIADQRGVRIRDVYREFGVVEGD